MQTLILHYIFLIYLTLVCKNQFSLWHERSFFFCKFLSKRPNYIDRDFIYKSNKRAKHPRGVNTFYRHRIHYRNHPLRHLFDEVFSATPSPKQSNSWFACLIGSLFLYRRIPKYSKEQPHLTDKWLWLLDSNSESTHPEGWHFSFSQWPEIGRFQWQLFSSLRYEDKHSSCC